MYVGSPLNASYAEFFCVMLQFCACKCACTVVVRFPRGGWGTVTWQPSPRGWWGTVFRSGGGPSSLGRGRTKGGRVWYPPYGPWEHVPAHEWAAPTKEDIDDDDVVGDNGDVCALCCTKSDPETMSMCDKCQLQYCIDCIGTHTCDNVTVL